MSLRLLILFILVIAIIGPCLGSLTLQIDTTTYSADQISTAFLICYPPDSEPVDGAPMGAYEIEGHYIFLVHENSLSKWLETNCGAHIEDSYLISLSSVDQYYCWSSDHPSESQCGNHSTCLCPKDKPCPSEASLCPYRYKCQNSVDTPTSSNNNHSSLLSSSSMTCLPQIFPTPIYFQFYDDHITTKLIDNILLQCIDQPSIRYLSNNGYIIISSYDFITNWPCLPLFDNIISLQYIIPLYDIDDIPCTLSTSCGASQHCSCNSMIPCIQNETYCNIGLECMIPDDDDVDITTPVCYDTSHTVYYIAYNVTFSRPINIMRNESDDDRRLKLYLTMKQSSQCYTKTSSLLLLYYLIPSDQYNQKYKFIFFYNNKNTIDIMISSCTQYELDKIVSISNQDSIYPHNITIESMVLSSKPYYTLNTHCIHSDNDTIKNKILLSSYLLSSLSSSSSLSPSSSSSSLLLLPYSNDDNDNNNTTINDNDDILFTCISQDATCHIQCPLTIECKDNTECFSQYCDVPTNNNNDDNDDDNTTIRTCTQLSSVLTVSLSYSLLSIILVVSYFVL